jgi:hypothetical protein
MVKFLTVLILYSGVYYSAYFIWTLLEYLITGEYEVRKIDTIMTILFSSVITFLLYKLKI